MSEYRNFFFYLVFANIYIISHLFDRSLAIKEAFSKVGIPYTLAYGGRLKYLTHITLSFQAIYFTLCTVNSLYEFKFNKNQPCQSKLRRFCNFLFTGIVWPAGALVTITFWGIYFVDRNLIYPPPIDQAIPSWQNHVMHTLPLLTGLIDSYFTKHTYNPSFINGFLPTIVYSLLYLVWVFFIAYHGGFWVYPILKHLGTFGRAIFIIGLLLFTGVLYKLGEIINNSFWPQKSLKVKRKE